MAATPSWLEISVEADRESADDLIALMTRWCAGGAALEEKPPSASAQSERVTIKGYLPAWDEETHQKLEIALLLLSRTAHISAPRTVLLEPKDWTEAWKEFFTPQRIGQRTVVVPTWHEFAAQPHETIIRLDPGMAFGTGLHATTRLCLAALERYLKAEDRVLDVGTGSGILAIAATLQGASHVDAIDVDPVAVEVATQNATLNKVSERINVSRGTLGTERPPDVPGFEGTGYNLLLVNILAEVIIRMAPAIAPHLKSGGLVIASGIISTKADETAEALERRGISILERDREQDWVSLIGRKG